MAAARSAVPVEEPAVGRLAPGARRREYLVGEHAHGHGDGGADALEVDAYEAAVLLVGHAGHQAHGAAPEEEIGDPGLL